MAYDANELLTSTTRAAEPRCQINSLQPKTYGTNAAETLLAFLTPLAIDSSDDTWKVWTQGTDEINTISTSGTVSGGTFTITAGGQTTSALDWDSTAAEIQTALEALSNVAPGDVVVTGGPVATADVVITWGGAWSGRAITVTVTDTNITGGGDVLIAETQAGVGASNSLNVIRGFVGEKDGVQTDATNTILGKVIMAGIIHRDDVPLPSGETQADLDDALRTVDVRKLGFTIQGLVSVG